MSNLEQDARTVLTRAWLRYQRFDEAQIDQLLTQPNALEHIIAQGVADAALAALDEAGLEIRLKNNPMLR